MNKYIYEFNDIAYKQGALGDGIKFWAPVDPEIICDKEKALLVIRKSIKSLGLTSIDLVGKCFNIVTTTSMALTMEGLKHTVTIGNVFVDNKPYFKTTMESIYDDLRIGYQPEEPAEAHAWLTLEDGTIIDITILSSIAHKNHKKPLKLIKAIYTSDDITTNIKHIPYFLGPMYVIRACTEPNEMSLLIANQWLTALDNLLNS